MIPTTLELVLQETCVGQHTGCFQYVAYQDGTIRGNRVAQDLVRDAMDSAGGPDGHNIAWWSL